MTKGKLKQVTTAAKQTVQLGVLASPEFQVAFGNLVRSTLPVKVAYQIMKVSEQVTANQKRYEELRQGLLNKYGKKDADGNLMMSEAKTEYLIDDRVGFNKEYNDLVTLEVETIKIPMSYIEEIKLPVNYLQVLVKTVLDPEA